MMLIGFRWIPSSCTPACLLVLSAMLTGSLAWVELPTYFEALNTAPQYQLTCVGGYAAVSVAEEVREDRFKIAGGRPGLKVCWQVTADRHDPFARDYRYQAEVDKDADERMNY